MLHPFEGRKGLSDEDIRKAGEVEFNVGDKVAINWFDGASGEGRVIGPPFQWTNSTGKKVRLVPVDQPRDFWSGQIRLQVILVMDAFLKKM